jgi:nitrate reductase gamma subunit
MTSMEQWLEFARGPLFRACLAIMLLGLLRAVLLNTVGLVALLRRSRRNRRKVDWMPVFTASLKWILPIKKGFEARAVFSFTSMLFHATIIITPIFLGAHILLWKRGIGISWPAIGNFAADYLTLIAIAAGIALFVERIGAGASRAISRAQDYFLPLLILVPFVSGYLAMHPAINPFGYNGTMFVHVMSGNLILLLIPFTKLSHVVLFPGTQLISELGWHLEPGAGERVAIALGKENEPI